MIFRGLGVLSTQLLAEFFWVLTRKVAVRVTPQIAQIRVEKYVRSWTVVSITSTIILEPDHGAAQHGFPFYDAQIWATARVHKIPIVVSEDFSHGSRIDSVEFLNPFVAVLLRVSWFRSTLPNGRNSPLLPT